MYAGTVHQNKQNGAVRNIRLIHMLTLALYKAMIEKWLVHLPDIDGSFSAISNTSTDPKIRNGWEAKLIFI